MSQARNTTDGDASRNGTAAAAGQDGRSENLRDSALMAHLLDALEAGQDIGHYGRLTFAMVARHFMEEGEPRAQPGLRPPRPQAQRRPAAAAATRPRLTRGCRSSQP